MEHLTKWPTTIAIGAAALVALAPFAGVIAAKARDTKHMMNIDIEKNPNLYFRIDSFSVPDAAREEFDGAMRRNMAFIKTLPGFLGHVVFAKAGGPTSFNVATMAAWENKEAFDKASVEVGAYYQKIGFDRASALARWGVKSEIGTFTARRDMQ